MKSSKYFTFATIFLLLQAIDCSGQKKEPSQAKSIRAFLQKLLGTDANPDTRVSIAIVPLEGEQHNEVIAYVSGSMFCGSGGCNLIILDKRGSHITVIGNVTITRPPIRVLTTLSFGHPDLGVLVAGGGINKAYEARLRFDGKHYPRNPTVPPASKNPLNAVGKTLITVENHGAALYGR